MEIGEQLRTARKNAGLTQAEVAKNAEIAINSLRLYESGKRQPNLEQLSRIAKALGISVARLMGWDSEKDIKLSLELQLSKDALSALDKFARTINIETGVTCMDTLNAILENPIFEHIISNILLFCERDIASWKNLSMKLNSDFSPDVHFSVEDVKRISKNRILGEFDKLIDEISMAGISPYNKVEKTQHGITIGMKNDTNILQNYMNYRYHSSVDRSTEENSIGEAGKKFADSKGGSKTHFDE